ncbi:PA3496 family putative envelope integrity protein [Shewanella sp. S23-S33]|jgi:hypothetical protein|uniref:PA3496 family putative envelope integrity protein n=1 Tax=Shewanella sp. S23-S33 TaxID=3342769 RepID=UPI00372D371E
MSIMREHFNTFYPLRDSSERGQTKPNKHRVDTRRRIEELQERRRLKEQFSL